MISKSLTTKTKNLNNQPKEDKNMSMSNRYSKMKIEYEN